MNKWQRVWLYIVIALASMHYLRDSLQDLGIQTFLTTSLIKAGHSIIFQANPLSPFKIYWAVFNTYTIAVVEIIFAIFCLRTNKFGKLGFATVCIAISYIFLWLFSWIIF